MVLARENDVVALQTDDVSRQTEVGVRPFMELDENDASNRKGQSTCASYLIGQRDEDGEKEHVHFEVVDASNVGVGPVGELVSHVEKVGNGDGEIVAVGLDEVMACDGRRIDVVLAKRPEKVSTDERHVHRTPGVGSPVDDARGQISRENSKHWKRRK